MYVKSPKRITIWSYRDVSGESRRFGRKVGIGSGTKVGGSLVSVSIVIFEFQQIV
jgi:hypothetical protein